MRLSSCGIGVVMPGRHVGNATIVPFADKLVREFVQISLDLRRIRIEFGFASASWSSLAPHPNGQVRVFPLAVGRHGDFEDAGGVISNVAEEEIAVVVHSASRNIVRHARRMLESTRLPLA